MTDEPRAQRAALIREQPTLCFVLVYATTFLGGAIAGDVLLACGSTGLSDTGRYLLPLAVGVPMWLGLRSWSHRLEPSTSQRPPE